MQVTAKLGGTQAKKAQKTVKKAASKVAGGAKKAQGKAKSTAKQTKNKAAPKSGAGNWYGPDRPKFLGTCTDISLCRRVGKRNDARICTILPLTISQGPSLSHHHTCLANSLVTTDGTQQVCQQTLPPLSDTGTLRSSMPDGPCLEL